MLWCSVLLQSNVFDNFVVYLWNVRKERDGETTVRRVGTGWQSPTYKEVFAPLASEFAELGCTFEEACGHQTDLSKRDRVVQSMTKGIKSQYMTNRALRS